MGSLLFKGILIYTYIHMYIYIYIYSFFYYLRGSLVFVSPQVSDMQAEFEAKQAADRDSIKRILKEKSLAEDVHAETMRQLEQDADREMCPIC